MTSAFLPASVAGWAGYGWQAWQAIFAKEHVRLF
jgi:hypothetical protein